MAKWAVILTVVALCFLGVLSQANSNIENTSPEETNSTASSLNANVTSDIPPASTNVDDPSASVKNNDHIEISASQNPSETPTVTKTSTFPPLVHNEHPEIDSVESTPATPSTVSTAKVPEMREAVTEMSHSATTQKPNSSNRLDLSLIVSLSSVLIWKFNY